MVYEQWNDASKSPRTNEEKNRTAPGVSNLPDCLVFPTIPLDDKGTCGLWTMKADGTSFRQITKPDIKATDSNLVFKLGDYDPWLSPAGDTVAFMRYFGGMDWRIYTASMKDGAEREITQQGVPNGIPKWSSDGKLITFVSWDKTNLKTWDCTQ